jgi:predicted metal-dependent HD superfamily phosphohydrolase
VGETASIALAQCYSEKGRFYHNLKHLENCLTEFHEIEANITDSYAVIMALLFHDLVYDSKAQQAFANETASWELAKQICQLNEPQHSAIKNHILHTSHSYSGDKNADTDYVCDIDMAILGYSEPEFQQYEANIRREYAFASDSQYIAGRSHFLQSLLESAAIFKTGYFYNKYEAAARANITRLIKQLSTI